MMRQVLWSLLRVTVCAITFAGTLPPQSAAAQTVTTGAFRNTAAVESNLLRGVTTKAAVRSLLGIPNGSGAARFAALGGDEREIWYYEDIEVTGAKSVDKTMKMDMRQQILLVLFKGEVVDGYLWTSNSGSAAATR
jgi:hypothetical protein